LFKGHSTHKSGPGELTIAYRILDANINRLREALRVVEEYFRFAEGDGGAAVGLKKMRHALQTIEAGLDPAMLLASRDSARDPLAGDTRPEERERSGINAVVSASLKRAQEAARVIEEYGKVAGVSAVSEIAKQLRFEVYGFEKRVGESNNNG
jgi:thiamine-phosphate pyrophosphorylase